ncbi:MAG: ABC transporter ATP-binding protein [Ignavibacteriaceae bacterium]|nr:ABC transporter ATP-binding protein [Ignavibacteriaceae bacterium]
MFDTILEIKDIKKRYEIGKNNYLTVINGANLILERNKISVIVGASGAGKSTLLHIAGALDNPTSGEVLFEKKSIFSLSQSKLAEFRSKRIGFIFQFHHLLPEFTAQENVAIPLMIGGESKKNALRKAEELLEVVGLSERLTHKPSALSGGEQQRTAVARAMANNPDLILADEPTGNLDSKNAGIINEIFIKLRDEFNKTLLIVTHNNSLMEIADTQYLMKDGKIEKIT